MRQRLATWGLSSTVLLLVAFGGWKWSERRDVERVVGTFLTAMIQGDTETLVPLLDGPALEALESNAAVRSDLATPIPGATAKIREVYLRNSTARVKVRWQVSGFDVWSDLELAKNPAGDWKITGIRQPKMIPTWEQVRQRAATDTQPAHEELSEQLEGRPGVEVRPLTPEDLDR